MALEVGDTEEGVGHVDFVSNGDSFEEGLVNPDLHPTIPPQAIGNEDGCIYHRIAETMLIGYRQMGDGFTAGPGIKGVGICEKRFSFISSYLIHYSPYEEGGDKGGVTFLPEMEFDSHQVLFLNLSFQIGAAQ